MRRHARALSSRYMHRARRIAWTRSWWRPCIPRGAAPAVWLLAVLIHGAPAARALEKCAISSSSVEDVEGEAMAMATAIQVGGHSLVQSMSFSRRIGAGSVKEEPTPTAASVVRSLAPHPESQSAVTPSSAGFASREESGLNSTRNASISAAATPRLKKLEVITSRNTTGGVAMPDVERPVSKEAGMQILMQLVDKGRQFATTASFNSAQASVVATSGMILIGVLVLLTCLVFYVLSFHPELSRLWEVDQKPVQRTPPRPMHDSRNYVDPRIMMGQPRMTPMTTPLASRTSVIATHGTSSRHEGVTGVSSSEEEDDRGTEAHFCPDLVVPQHCECILLVPAHTNGRAHSFDISDMNGSIVLRCATQIPGGYGSEHSLGAGHWRLFLMSPTGENLAQCREVRPTTSAAGPSGATEFHFLRNGGHYFAKLMYRGQDRFELHSLAGKRLHFWGNFRARAVNVTDDSGRLLATTELHTDSPYDDGSRFRLRVAPLTDVGLALCGLLCMRRQSWSFVRGCCEVSIGQ